MASNTFGVTRGPDQVFTTLAEPVIIAGPASEYGVPPREEPSVTVNAEVNPENGGPVTACAFEFGPSSAYGKQTPCLGPSNEQVGTALRPIATMTAVHARFTDLSPGEITHFRVVATSEAGTSDQSDQTVTAIPLKPVVLSTTASGVTRNDAKLEAQVDPNFGVTVYLFEYGLNAVYSDQTYTSTPPLSADGQPHLCNRSN